MQLVQEAQDAGDGALLQQRIAEANAAGVPEWQLEGAVSSVERFEIEKRLEAALRGHPVEEALLARCCDEAEAMGLRSPAVQRAQGWLRDRRMQQKERREVESAVRAVLRYAQLPEERSPEPPAIGSRPGTPAAKGASVHGMDAQTRDPIS